jgi:hypothetical protein
VRPALQGKTLRKGAERASQRAGSTRFQTNTKEVQ